MDKFSFHLVQLRRESGLSQGKVAAMLGIREASYQKYEYGSAKPRVVILTKLGELFQVSLDYLCGITQEKVSVSRSFPADIPLSLSKNIRADREKLDLTQQDIAASVGVSASAYQQYELHLKMPSYHTLIKLAEILHLALDEALGRWD